LVAQQNSEVVRWLSTLSSGSQGNGAEARPAEAGVDPELEAFLAGRTPFARETATWGDLDLVIRYFQATEPPPEHLVTSVRAVIFSHGRVLTVREPDGTEHIVPGGRRVTGESFEETVRREVLEETRWTVGDLSLLSVVHFEITSPVPEGYPYPHPDFLQLIYITDASEYHPNREIDDDWVAGCALDSIDALLARNLSEPQRRLLLHAVRYHGG